MTITATITANLHSLEASVIQNILFVADQNAAHAIRSCGTQHGVAVLQDVDSPYDTSLDPGQAFQSAPDLENLVKQEVANRGNWPIFAITDALTMDASRQARRQLVPDQWYALVRAAAAAILADLGLDLYQKDVDRHILFNLPPPPEQAR